MDAQFARTALAVISALLLLIAALLVVLIGVVRDSSGIITTGVLLAIVVPLCALMIAAPGFRTKPGPQR